MKRVKVITMKNRELSTVDGENRVLCKNKKINYKTSIIDSKVSLKNSRLKLIIEGEEIFAYTIVTPRTRKNQLYLIVRNELINKFHDIENFIFHYKVYDKDKNILKVMIYCINISKIPLLKDELFENSTIESIDVIQEIYLNHNKKILKEYFKKIKGIDKTLNYKKFILVARKAEYVYIVKVENGILVSNRAILFSEHKTYGEIIRILKDISKDECEIKRVYTFVKLGYENIKIASMDEIENYLLESRFLAKEINDEKLNRRICAKDL